MTSRNATDCVRSLCLWCRSSAEVVSSSSPARPQPTPKPEIIAPAAVSPRRSSKERAPSTKPVTASMNLCVEHNRSLHHTNNYGEPELIVRRGQVFDVIVFLSENFDEKNEEIRLSFATGRMPQHSKNTLIKVKLVNKLKPTEWGAMVDRVEGKEVHLHVMPSAEAIVGEYSVYVELLRRDASGTLRGHKHAQHPRPMYIIFNAWCEDDAVYAEDERNREEYVLNETGRIYRGSAERISEKPWIYGQFARICFQAALYLLDKSSLKTTACGNVILVTRALTSMANANDNDAGVLVGKWSGSYDGGKSPSKWNGSVSILEEYMRTKREVKFGQCWVFSGLLTTLCRTLGIPTRSVTNFDSAHDTDLSMTIDSHIDNDGNPLKALDDSVWNFHVWNESWFRRVDLPSGNDGWQVIDSTPQERSEGAMQCGPAPVAAIRNGDVYLGYDSKFIFAEVNGDRIVWQVDPSGEMHVIGGDTSAVGAFVSTKAVGSNRRHDITRNYKYEEGSEQERETVKKVARYSTRSTALEARYNARKDDDVVMNLAHSRMDPNGDVHVKLSARNNSDESRQVNVLMFATAKYYTGTPGDDLGNKQISLQLNPLQEKEAVWLFKSEFFLYRLDEDATVGVYVTAKVKQTKQIFATQKTFFAEKPSIELLVTSNKIKVGNSFKLKMTFRNPLDVPLTKGAFYIESPGIQKEKKIPLHRAVAAHEEVEQIVMLTAVHPGIREILATFHCAILVGISGVARVQVYQ